MTFRVAVTRPQPQADATAASLRRAGYDVLLAPLTEVTPGEGPGDAAGIGAIAMTSRTAAHLLAEAPAFHDLPVYAVGDATAEDARRAGFRRVQSAAGDVDDLLRLLADAPEPIVHMAGADHTGDLAERLSARGQRARRRIVYAMRPVPDLPPADRVDAVLIYSPRTARLFAERARSPVWRAATCVALSEAVAEPLAGWGTVVASSPDEPALFAALAGVRATATAATP